MINLTALNGTIASSHRIPWSLIPPGVPDPVVWFSAAHVELDGSSKITKILNQGTLGSAHDALPTNPSYLAGVTTAGGQAVFDIPSGTRQYNFAASGDFQAQSVFTIATYKTGAETTFGNYDGLFDGPPSVGESSSVALIGHSGTGHVFSGNPDTLYKNGVALGDPAVDSILPLNFDTVCSTEEGVMTTNQVGVLWCDNAVNSRRWVGVMGEFLVFDVELNATQVAALHGTFNEFYGGS